MGHNNKEYLFTDKEFSGALIKWSRGESYYCKRLEVLIWPPIVGAETPRPELGKEIFLVDGFNHNRKFFYKDNDLYELGMPGVGAMKFEFFDDEDKKNIESKLISQEDYYDKLPGGLLSVPNNKKLLK